jgi:hypothetical protein
MPSSERPALTGLGPAIVRPRMLLGVLLSALLLSPFAFRVFLIHKYPGVYSWDALSRLWGAKNLVVRHWLPLPQLPVFFTEAYDWEIATMRMVYAAIGVAGSAVLGWFVYKQTNNRSCGIATFLLVSFMPVFTVFSIVPYQEGFLILFLFGFLCTREFDPETNPWRRSLEPFLLACACLCRYEAWIFAGLIALRPLVERRWKDLLPLVPAAIVMVLWLVILPHLDTNKLVTNPVPTPGIEKLLAVTWEDVSAVSKSCMNEFAQLGLALGLLGALVALRKGGLLGREMLVFGLVLYGLAIMRSANATISTNRMTLLISVCTAIYIPIGLNWLATQVRPTWRHPVFVCLLVYLLYPLPFEGRDYVKRKSLKFESEELAAVLLLDHLQQSPPGARYGFLPRRKKNVLSESIVNAIFANSTQLDPEDPRWVFDEDVIRRDMRSSIDYLLWYHWAKGRYELVDVGLLRERVAKDRADVGVGNPEL